MTPDIRHKHLIVRAEVAKPTNDTNYLSDWLSSLIQNMGMELMMGPYVAYSELEGNRGITGVAVITTSHLAVHMWDECEPAIVQLDIYTCSELEPNMVFEHLDKFEPVKVEWKFLDREHELIDITESHR